MRLPAGLLHHDALELLERALGYTRGALATVGPDRSGPTPCAAWTLADLLAHLDDGLDAFLEAAEGAVRVPGGLTAATGPPAYACADPGGARPLRPVSRAVDLAELQSKGCRLLGAWSVPRPEQVAVGDTALPARLLVSAAALEITVHGWDVGEATGGYRRIPDSLAEALMPVAHVVVTPGDRPARFARPVRTTPDASSAEVLLGFLGRSRPALTGPDQ